MRSALAVALLLLILGSGCAGSRAEKAAPGAAEEPRVADAVVDEREGPQTVDAVIDGQEETQIEAPEEEDETVPAGPDAPAEDAPEPEDPTAEGPQAEADTAPEGEAAAPASPTINRLREWTKEAGVRIDGVSSSTMVKDGEYLMYYTGDGIELARSSDGLNFVYTGQLIGGDDVEGVDMVTNPMVFETQDGRYRMIFEGGTHSYDKNDRRLYSAVSSDGLRWTVEPGVRFQDAGDGKPGELFTSVPDVVRLDDGRLRMYYTRGATSATALSDDDGLTWTKERNLELRKVAIDLDLVRLEDRSYRLFFTTFAGEFGVGEQWVTSADSTDGLTFELKNDKLIWPSTPGGQVTDPDIVRVTGGYRMYYGEFKSGEENRPNIMSAFSAD